MIQTVDAIIIREKKILLIKRKFEPFGYAMPGGLIDPGEDAKQAVVREVEEETHLQVIDAKQFGYYDAPGRDPRGDYASTVFVCECKGDAKAGDDAKQLEWVPLDKIDQMDFAFDHKKILQDYLKTLK